MSLSTMSSTQVSSRTASRTQSIMSQPPTPVIAPAPRKAAAHAVLPQVNSSTFKSKLKNMFDQPRSTTFEVNVTIHELGNIPQLGGQFAVRWKFRGRRPPDADRLLEHPVQRTVAAVEHKLHPKSQAKSLRHSASARSLGTTSTTSTTGTSTPSPTWTTNINRVLTPHAPTPLHAASLPVPSGHSHQATFPEARHIDRKSTDPTPLRQSSKLDDFETDSSRLIIEEPDHLGGEGTAASDGSDDAPNSHETTSSTVPTLTTEGETSTTRSVPSIVSGKYYPASLGPESSTPSLASTTAVVPDANRSRVPSRASTYSDHSNPSVVISRPTRSLHGDKTPDSTERKGRTPTCAIRSHAVTWEYKIQHVIRVPLGKPVEVETPRHSQKAGHQQSLPILGGGPLSVSGLKLDIEEVDQRGESVKTPSGKDVLFGFVNIDLAPFADQGPVTRKFLLKNSKTNATIRITIDMKYLGGEQEWASPPMEGHVVQGISELTGEEHYSELQLLPSTSISSGSDGSFHSSISARPASRSGVNLAKLPSSITAAAQATKHRYRTYDHHLLPEVISKKQSMQRRSTSQTQATGRSASTPPASWMTPSSQFSMSSWPSNNSGASTGVQDRSPNASPKLFANGEGAFTTSPLSTPALLPKPLGSPTSSPGLMPISPPRHSSYLAFGSTLSPTTSRTDGSLTLSPVVSRGSMFSRLSPITTRMETSPSDSSAPNSAFMSPELGISPHIHHSHFLRDRDDDAHDLQPDVVIENIFNPTASEEYTPFTYLAKLQDAADAEEDDGPEDDVDDEDDDKYGTLVQSRHGVAAWRKIGRRVLSHPHHKCS